MPEYGSMVSADCLGREAALYPDRAQMQTHGPFLEKLLVDTVQLANMF